MSYHQQSFNPHETSQQQPQAPSSSSSDSGRSSSNPLWPEGHPRHLVDTWLKNTYGSLPPQSDPSVPCLSKPSPPLFSATKKMKWTISLGETAFTSGRRPAAPNNFGRQRRNSMGAMPSLRDLDLNDYDDELGSESGTAGRFPGEPQPRHRSMPTYPGHVPAADSSGEDVAQQMEALRGENERLKAQCAALTDRLRRAQASAPNMRQDMPEPGSRTGEPEMFHQQPEQDEILRQAAEQQQQHPMGTGPEYHGAQQAEAAAAYGTRMHPGGHGMGGIPSQGHPAMPPSSSSWSSVPRSFQSQPAGVETYWQQLRAEAARRRNLEAMAGDRPHVSMAPGSQPGLYPSPPPHPAPRLFSGPAAPQLFSQSGLFGEGLPFDNNLYPQQQHQRSRRNSFGLPQPDLFSFARPEFRMP